MKKSKLIDLLKLLSKSELRDFEKFVASPYFNKDAKLITIFNFIKRYYPEFDSKKLDKTYIVEKIFPSFGKDGHRKVNYLMSDLTKLLEDFFIQAQLGEEQFDREYLMLRALQKRKADKYFFSLVDKMKTHLQVEKENMDYFYNHFRLNHQIYGHPSTNRYQPHINSLTDAIDFLDLFYVSTKLRYSSEMINRQWGIAEEYEIPMLEAILKNLERHPFDDYAIFGIYKRIIQLNQKNDHQVYLELKQLIIDNFERFEKEEQTDLIIFLNNYTIFCIPQDENVSERFDVLKFSLKYDIWTQNGTFSYHAFLNFINIGCAMEDFEWTNQFYEEYGPRLRDDLRENTLLLSRAIISYTQEQFEKTLELLNFIDFTDINFNLLAKSLLLRCYYELPDYELVFFDFCNAFSQFIRRNKTTSETNYHRYINLINITRKLFRFKTEKSVPLEKIQAELENLNPVANRQWLKVKINELSGSKVRQTERG